MRWLRWLVPGALISAAACGSVDRTALDHQGLPDAGGSVDRGLDAGTPSGAIDAGTTTPIDTGSSTPPVDAGTTTPPPVDAGEPVTPPPIDAGGPTTPPPVDAGSPATPPPTDAGHAPDDAACTACTAFAPIAFCPGTGTCVPYRGCTTAGCAICAMPVTGGDNCANPVMLSSTGRSRLVVSTCGARDDIDTGCGGSGPDLVVGVRVARRGRVVVRMTVPAGVMMNFGYDLLVQSCREQRLGRQCASRSFAATQSLDLTLDAGTYYVYVVTSQGSTVVVETELP